MSSLRESLEKTQTLSGLHTQRTRWTTFLREAQNTFIAENLGHALPPHLLKPPPHILKDVQMAMECIRTASQQPGLRVIGFTSSVSGEGTSTLASLIAAQMAVQPLRRFDPSHALREPGQDSAKGGLDSGPQGIMFIDTQWRNPALHRIFQLHRLSGLREFLSGQDPLPAVAEKFTASNLEVITAGRTDNTPPTLTELEKLDIFLSYLRLHYTTVFLDIPALMHFPEGIRLSRLCDGVIFVVRAHNTRSEIIAEAMSLLRHAKVKVLGCMLNQRKYFVPDWLYRRL